jgi:hypothetical protein
VKQRKQPYVSNICSIVMAAAAIALLTAPVQAQQSTIGSEATTRTMGAGDYDPDSSRWNGLMQFRDLATGMGFEFSSVSSLEWGDLGADEILVFLYPEQTVDPGQLDAFIQAGGHAIVADDFGEAKNALARLGAMRLDVTTLKAASYYEGRTWAPIAMLNPGHPIALDVDQVVTNHPAALGQLAGGTIVAGFDEGALVVAGERGTGRYIAVADPSIFINRMLEFPGNLRLVTNMLHWLDRNGRAKHVVVVHGDVAMYGQARPYIDDANAGKMSRSIASVNRWLDERSTWLLVPAAMRAVGIGAGILVLGLLYFAIPWRRDSKADGAWLALRRPQRRDDAFGLVQSASKGSEPHLISACLLRDFVQQAIALSVNKPEPLYTVAEAQLPELIRQAKGADAATAYNVVAQRLRRLPSRGQAAAPWGGGFMSKREFDTFYDDCATLCRKLEQPLET